MLRFALADRVGFLRWFVNSTRRMGYRQSALVEQSPNKVTNCFRGASMAFKAMTFIGSFDIKNAS
jgi:hypothetical protein